MTNDLQRASTWKRIAAWIFDGILVCVLAVGFAALISLVTGYDGYVRDLDAAYEQYESAYGITFDIAQEEYLAFSDAQRQLYDEAYAALTADKDAMVAYNMALNLSLIMTSLGIFLAILALEFVVPLLLGNGQTLGKKIFGICLVRNDGVKINNLQLFTRTVLGKFTIETMIPVYILLMVFWNTVDVVLLAVLAILGIAQLVLLAVTYHRTLIHDLLAGTVAVDMASQQIFRSTEDLIEYKKKIHAERAARQDY